jgi:tetratricopeptide (TPR) repeat protein
MVQGQVVRCFPAHGKERGGQTGIPRRGLPVRWAACSARQAASFSFPWVCGLLLWLGGQGAAMGIESTSLEHAQALHARMAAEDIPPSLRKLYLDYSLGEDSQRICASLKLGLASARETRYSLASRALDEALVRIRAAQSALSSKKRAMASGWFLGEPYERAALYFYRAVLYVQQGDYGAALGAAKKCLEEDGVTEEDGQGNWASAAWIAYYAATLAGDEEGKHQALGWLSRIKRGSKNLSLPNPQDNILVLVETGEGPHKLRRGKNGEILVLAEGPDRVRRVSVGILGQKAVLLDPMEDLYAQATTWHGNHVEAFVNGQPVSNPASGDQSQGEESSGVFLPTADTRAWSNLPHKIFLASLRCPEGTTRVRLQGLGEGNRVVAESTWRVPVTSQKPTGVIWDFFP